MIHKVEGVFVISSHEVWLPGHYADERAAKYAFRLPTKALQELQDGKNAGDRTPITFDELKAKRLTAR